MSDLVLGEYDDLDGGGLFLGTEIDLTDETVLRTLQTVVEDVVGAARGVKVSVLSVDQWDTAVTRLVPKALRRSVRHHFHILADPRSRGHLLVGPSTLTGLNERSPQITAEVAYALVKAGRPVPPPIFQRAAADILVAEVSKAVSLPLFAHNYANEALFVGKVIATLQREHPDFTQLEWVQLLKTAPSQFFIALRKSAFASLWLMEARRDVAIIAATGDTLNKTSLTKALASSQRRISDDFVVFTDRCISAYLTTTAETQGEQ